MILDSFKTTPKNFGTNLIYSYSTIFDAKNSMTNRKEVMLKNELLYASRLITTEVS